jgi:hypothetical protein
MKSSELALEPLAGNRCLPPEEVPQFFNDSHFGHLLLKALAGIIPSGLNQSVLSSFLSSKSKMDSALPPAADVSRITNSSSLPSSCQSSSPDF